jgi:hypothetical protein
VISHWESGTIQAYGDEGAVAANAKQNTTLTIDQEAALVNNLGDPITVGIHG